MILLKNVCIHKYKCIESDQSYEVDEKITLLVGMNESGKTSILEALAKTHYFQKDDNFVFNTTHDYPRKEKKNIDKSGENPKAVTCNYIISDELIETINIDIGNKLFSVKEFSRTTKYDNSVTISNISVKYNQFIDNFVKKNEIKDTTIIDSLMQVKTIEDLNTITSSVEDETITQKLDTLKQYLSNDNNWSNPIDEYIYRNYIKPNLPKFLYYDEYYLLPSRISIEKLQNEKLDSDELKTAKALFELADININEIINSNDFEDFKAELEATEAIITEELFKYWTTNTNLDIQFDIDKIEQTIHPNNKQIVEHVLDIRVKNSRTRMSLPLKNRSKGFNWFFSFLVWFKKIQEDETSNYILLLDEPGLNLHASAQSDLLNFIEDLSEKYQIIYTTHSPFMVDPLFLHRVRTVVETDKGSTISDSIQEKDPKTLFPLQAALGYDIAQNLFISKNNLLVEGVSDLIIMQFMSALLEKNNKPYLDPKITIVPVGGLDKVSTFVSLLRGSKLSIACLLDSNVDIKSKSKLDNVIRNKLIQKQNIKFFDEFISDYESADIEDLFEKEEYLYLFNNAFEEYDNIELYDLNSEIKQIIIQINRKLGIERYNHYRPANELIKSNLDMSFFNGNTIKRFTELFEVVNKLFKE